jgi:ribose 1,5-bisphosphokinase
MHNCLGHLVLVVGPSGVGKDSIIRGAQEQLSGNRNIVFPRRVVTRPVDAIAEDHDVMSEMAFSLAIAGGEFALWWRAHGLGYGIPISIEDDLKLGRIVIFNCSRTVIGEALTNYHNVTVAEISVSSDLLVDRIVARGRESRDEALKRVARAVPTYPIRAKIHRVENNGALSNAIDAFCDLIQSLDNLGPDPGRNPLNKNHEQEDGDNGRRRLVVVEHFK